MGRLFKRGAKVIVADREFQLRIAFQVEKNSEAGANKAQVTLYNLSDDSRGFIERATRVVGTLVNGVARKSRPGELLRALAGYDGELTLLFAGNLTRVTNVRSGPDLATTMECGDGQVALETAKIALSYKAGVSEATVAQAAIQQLKALGLREGSVATFSLKEYKTGFAYSGPAADLLKRLAKNQGLEFSVQDGLIQVLQKNGATQEAAVALSQDTGLVGFPTKTDEGFQAKSLLNPELRPGRKVVLTSRQTSLNGTYLIRKVVHQGDTFEGEFITAMEGRLLG